LPIIEKELGQEGVENPLHRCVAEGKERLDEALQNVQEK
jgi:hypothetical protein